jgi:predicted RNA-binding Zn-ribbon protein involved in translation (DUF1610 family)
MKGWEIQAMARQLAARHAIPKSGIKHPPVVVIRNGEVDEFMTAKLREEDYVPYCLIKPECARVRRKAWGFECPNCGNKMNWDLKHYDGNQNVVYAEGYVPPPLTIQQWNEQVEIKKQKRAQERAANYLKG